MKTIYSQDHYHHQGKYELINGEFLPPFENVRRMEIILERIKSTNFGEIISPKDFGLEPIKRIHTERFVNFLQTAHDAWRKLRGDTDALPLIWPNRGLRMIEPDSIDGKLGYFSYDAGYTDYSNLVEGYYVICQCGINWCRKNHAGRKNYFFIMSPTRASCR